MNTQEETNTAATDAPGVERIRHELRRRNLTVMEHSYITPNMIRIKLAGHELDGFTSLSPDDHVKIFVPGREGEEMQKRDFTPRHYDPRCQTLTLDFVAHEGGPATSWAQRAKVGDRLELGGPRGSQVITGDIRNWLLIGDETALPAIGRRIEELPDSASVTSLVAVPGKDDEQVFETNARLSAYWLHRDLHDAADSAPYLARLAELTLTPDTFVWIAGEANVVKAVSKYLIDERGHSKVWMKASGYWKQGAADSAEKNIGED